MYHDFTYQSAYASSLRAQWKLDDVLRADQELDFSRDFLPDSLAQTAAAPGLGPRGRRLLNQICAHQYLCQFAAVEEIILPFLLQHVSSAEDEHQRTPALTNFADEERKHIAMFDRFRAAFTRAFPVACPVAGPPERLGELMAVNDPLAVGLVILMFEWMTQAHYVSSVRGNDRIDPLFRSLLKHHWMEEAQHAKLDTLLIDGMAAGRSAEDVDRVVTGFFQITTFFDRSLGLQAQFNVDALAVAIGRPLANRRELISQQFIAARRTYLGLGMAHERFGATVAAMSPGAAARVARAAQHYSGPLAV